MLGSGPNRLWLGNRRFICSFNELTIRKCAPCMPLSSLTTFYPQHPLFFFFSISLYQIKAYTVSLSYECWFYAFICSPWMKSDKPAHHYGLVCCFQCHFSSSGYWFREIYKNTDCIFLFPSERTAFSPNHD